ncbi:hypothetical protein H1R20_g14576, partial [Candolleomyces eurysporus]
MNKKRTPIHQQSAVLDDECNGSANAKIKENRSDIMYKSLIKMLENTKAYIQHACEKATGVANQTCTIPGSKISSEAKKDGMQPVA